MSRLRRTATPSVIAVVVFLAYAIYSCSRYSQWLTAGYDLGIFDQTVRDYAHFHAPLVALKGPHYNIFGDHFHPILMLLAPLYWVWDDPRSLLIAQAALIAGSVVFVYRFCLRHTSTKVAAVLAIGYALGWPIQGMADFDFHEIAFGLPLLAWAIDAFDRKSDRELLVAGVLLLFVREDLGMVVAILGAIRAWRRPRRAGFVLIAAGIFGYVVATSIVLPHFASNGKFAYWSYDALGPNLPSAVKTIVAHPFHTAHVFFSPGTKVRTMLWLFAPLVFLSLLSPYVLLSLPILAERFFSSRDHLWTTEFHYSAVIWTILFLAAFDGARRIKLTSSRAATAGFAAVAFAVPVLGTASDPAMWPLYRLIHGSAFGQTAHMRDQAAIVAAIPRNTCVEADDRLADHLTHTNRVTLPTLADGPSDFVALDLSQAEVGYLLPTPESLRATSLASGYREILTRGSVVLLRRSDYAGPSSHCKP